MKSNKYVLNSMKLLQEWDWEKNSALGLDPSKLTCSSHKMAWWKCSVCGNEFQGMIVSRYHASSCWNCRLKKRSQSLLVKRGSLAALNPELAAEWHPTKNGALSPEMVLPNSPKKVWWQCKKGHEWEESPNARQSSGCPFCSGQRVWQGYNDLATKYPDLATQWHPTKNGKLLPTQISSGSKKIVWWLGKCGHEWEASISNRCKTDGCPFCSSQRVLKGFNDLATTHPLVAAEWCYERNGQTTPDMVMAGSDLKVWWQCERGHVWEARIAHRSNGSGCPICSGERQTSFPEQAILYYCTKVTTAKSRYRINGKTEIDVYLPEYNIGIEYDGLRFHKGEDAIRKENKKDNMLAKQGIFLLRLKERDSEGITVDSGRIVYYKYTVNSLFLGQAISELFHIIETHLNQQFDVDINIERDRSAIFSLYVEVEKEKSLLEIDPMLAAEWHPTKNGKLLPEMVKATSNKAVWWQCEKGHEWQAAINNRRAGKGCPYCSNREVLSGYNDLETINPTLASQWHPNKNYPLEAKSVLPYTNKKVWWKCEKGHEWQATVNSRSNGTGCPICYNAQRGLKRRKTHLEFIEEMKESGNPSVIILGQYQNSGTKILCRCAKCGYEWLSFPYSLLQGHGCKMCAAKNRRSN